MSEEIGDKSAPENPKKLFEDLLSMIVYEDAGVDTRFMYIWRKDWLPLRERIERYLRD